jgi:hypothetical protein
LYEGAPRRPLDVEGGWPKGWIEQIYQRGGGATKGRPDSYWYTPNKMHKIRSIVNVKLFLSFLEKCNGDEDAAYKMLPVK